MKNCLTSLFNASIYRHILRMLIVCVCLSYSTVANAWSGNATFIAKVSNTGNGKVYVSESSIAPADENLYTDAAEGSTYTQNIGSSSSTAIAYFYAKPNSDDYTFAGWSASQNGTNPDGKSGEAIELTGSDSNIKPSITYYAVFKSIYDIPITFKATTNGSYTATHTTTAVGSHKYTISTTEESLTDIDSKSALTITFKATAASGYSFLRWKLVENPNTAEEKVTYNYTNPEAGFQKEFAAPTDVYVEFAPTGKALFIVKGNVNQTYLKLSDAIAAAVSSSSKVIVVFQSGELYQETDQTNYYNLSTNTYTIPSGVTLLVPCNDSYDLNNGIVKDTEDYVQLSSSSYPAVINNNRKEFSNLTIPNNVKLNFLGNLCVAAKVLMMGTGSESWNNVPIKYGHLHLNDGAEITMNVGTTAIVYGYISGNPTTTKVVAKGNDSGTAGANIYEMMQVRDYRGGGATTLMLDNSEKVFMFNHYFLQNVETLLELEYGAKQSVSAGFSVGSSTPCATVIMVAPRQGTGIPSKDTESALFYIAKGTTFKKYLDRTLDRQVYIFTSDVESESLLDKVILNISGLEMNSADYTFPISSNIDVRIEGHSKVRISYPIAMLAGSSIYLGRDAEVIANSNVYVYDRDQLKVQVTQDGLGSLVKNNWYYYFSPGNYAPHKLQLSYQSQTPTVTRDENWPLDAKVDLNGKLTGAIYTTGDGTGDKPGGAAIVSTEGTGQISLLNLSSNTKAYQAVQYNTGNTLDQILQRDDRADRFSIPVTSAKLMNGNASYSAGNGTADNGKTYKYYPLASNGEGQAKGRWLAGIEDGIELELVNNSNKVTTKIPESKDMWVQFTPELSENLSITSFSADVQGANFVKTDGKETQVVDGVYSVPVTFTPTGTHDAKPEGKIIITFTCSNSLTGENPQIVKDIPLYGQEYYLPEFSILGDGVTEGNTTTYDFGTLEVGSSSVTKGIQVQTVEHTVTDRNYNSSQGYATWTLPSVSTPFTSAGNYFDATTFSINPATTAVDSYEQELTITAKYSEGVETTKTIVLRANIIKQSNSLAFIDDLKSGQYTIYQGQVINDIFANEGNGGGISYTYNEQVSDPNGLVSIDANGKLTVAENASIVDSRTISIRATQGATETVEGKVLELVLTVVPPAIWNWSKLYFNTEVPNVDYLSLAAVSTDINDIWTLKKTSDAGNLVTLIGENSTNGYTATIGQPANPEDLDETFTATFFFQQGDYTNTFTSQIYKDPRILPIRIHSTETYAARTFEDVSKNRVNVSWSDDAIVFDANSDASAVWTMQLKGVPDLLKFIPSGSNDWSIEESANGTTWSTTRALASIQPGVEFVHQLTASTQYIRITCNMGVIGGSLSDFRITELSEKIISTTEAVYLPIEFNKFQIPAVQTATQEKLSVSYVSQQDLTISLVDGEGNAVSGIAISNDLNNENGIILPATTAGYNEAVITLTNTAVSAEADLYLQVTSPAQGFAPLRLPVYTYLYPQKLPLKSALWIGNNAKRFHFYSVRTNNQTKNVRYDAANQQVVFSNAANSERWITFAFQGGPRYMSFETTFEMTSSEWNAYWSVSVFDGNNSPMINEEPTIKQTTKSGVKYYQVYLPIPHTTKTLTLRNTRQTELAITNLIIDGDPDLDVQPGNSTIEHTAKYVFKNTDIQDVTVTAINLATLKVRCNNSNFDVKFNGTAVSQDAAQPTVLDATTCPGILDDYEVGNLTFQVSWKATNTIDEGLLIFTDAAGKELATVRLLGTQNYITADNADETGLYTGFAKSITSHPFQAMFAEDEKYKYERHQVNLSNAFVNGIALFDYLIVYGETTTTTNDNTTTITAPTGANIVGGVSTGKGSNAKTPYYIYRKALDGEGQYTHYQLVGDVENANVANKADLEQFKEGENQQIPHAQEQDLTKCIQIGAGESLKVYVTGFCPYATTGYDKRQEGVWLFRGKPTAKLDLYLEDCHIYSRNKTESGCSSGKFDFDNIFDDAYACGSGGVFVFENNVDKNGDVLELVPELDAFQVNIHTRGLNVLKSNYGSFYQIYGMRAYQVSSPIQVRVSSDGHVEKSRTHLTFDDLWPTQGEAVRTNGFLSLQKLANNAPSIDLGNPQTVVNFRGGQVELQNAQNVSDKYKTTLAISYRSGIMAAGGIELQMAYGIGTDDATKGTVNFYDGTITVIPMEVDESERQYYLMDTEITTDGEGNQIETELTTTSCLRCPQNTFVHGGSICMLRACMSPTSKGGAPTDGVDNGSGEFTPLGRFIYDGSKYSLNYYNNAGVIPSEGASLEKWLVKPTDFPEHEVFGLLSQYYNRVDFNYGLNSVTPDKKGNLTLWIPQGYGDVKVEIDRYLIPWKACMTEIEAGLGTFTGRIGGNVSIENNEDVSNLLYCHLDDFTHAVISEHDEISDPQEGIIYSYKYSAPVKTPDNFQMQGMEIGEYFTLQPTNVGDKVYEITNAEAYKIHNKVYYITTALSDTWMNFTMPFDVENIYVVESYPDFKLEKQFEIYNDKFNNEQLEDEEWEKIPENVLNNIVNPSYSLTRLYQGKHNADFASFFGMAMALGSDASFEEMQQDFLDWAYLQDSGEGADDYKGTRENYDWRGVWPLTHYDGSIESFMNSNFYLYENTADWTVEMVDGRPNSYKTNWQIVSKRVANQPLLRKGHTYSMLFPYCWGCDEEPYDMEREYWDYWTGKFLIFESTDAEKTGVPHEIAGRNQAIDEFNVSPSSGNAKLTGNISFAKFKNYDDELFYYQSSREKGGSFLPLYNTEEQEFATIYPTNTLLNSNLMNINQVQSIGRDGKINYYNSGNSQGPTTGGHVPTVGGGNDMFITAIDGGINIAVAAPQNIYVVNATGHILYNGYVTTDVNVMLPINGIYVVKGENEAQKIFF